MSTPSIRGFVGILEWKRSPVSFTPGQLPNWNYRWRSEGVGPSVSVMTESVDQFYPRVPAADGFVASHGLFGVVSGLGALFESSSFDIRRAVPQLSGTFAIAVWDGTTNELLLATDIVGSVPLYYLTRPGVLIFGTDFRVVSHWSTGQINEGHFAGYAAGLEAPSTTAIADIHRVPPAHIARLSETGVYTDRYWSSEDAPTQRAYSDADYEHGLADRLERAMSSRFSAGRLGFEVSGGGRDPIWWTD